MSLFRSKRNYVECSLVRDLQILLQISFKTLEVLLVHDSRIHPKLEFIIVLSDFDSDAVRYVDESVLGTDQAKNAVLP